MSEEVPRASPSLDCSREAEWLSGPTHNYVATSESDNRDGADSVHERIRHRAGTDHLSVVHRHERHGDESDRRSDIHDVHDSGADKHDTLLGPGIESIG